jgi:hypothetical protein
LPTWPNAGIGEAAVKALEAVDTVPSIAGGGIAQTLRAESLDKVRKAFTKACVTFLPDDGKAGVGSRLGAWPPMRRMAQCLG